VVYPIAADVFLEHEHEALRQGFLAVFLEGGQVLHEGEDGGHPFAQVDFQCGAFAQAKVVEFPHGVLKGVEYSFPLLLGYIIDIGSDYVRAGAIWPVSYRPLGIPNWSAKSLSSRKYRRNKG